jgi:hypothetical protein
MDVREQADPLAPAFGGAALGASIFILFGALALIGAIMGTKLPLVSMVAEKNLTMWVLAGIGAAPAVLFFIVGAIIGKSR